MILASAPLLAAGVAVAGGVTPGFQSLPVTFLYSAFRTKSTFTASSISPCKSLFYNIQQNSGKKHHQGLFNNHFGEYHYFSLPPIHLITLGAFFPFKSLTKLPCFVILSLRSWAFMTSAGGAQDRGWTGFVSGFQSEPEPDLYSAFRANKILTSASTCS